MKPGKLLLCASLALFSITAQAQCPDMTGSYRFTGAEHPFYLVKIPGQSRYNAFFPNEAGQFTRVQTVDISAEEMKTQQIPECALIIQRVGMMMKTSKGEKVDVMTQSQNYTTEKTITTEYGLMIYAGFASDFIGIDKISAQVPKEAQTDTLPLITEAQ